MAAAAVATLAAVNYHGITRTARLTRIIVAVVLSALAVVVVSAIVGADPQWSRVTFSGGADGTWYGVLQSAGLLFFAFAGYARIATMGEEVRSPERTVPRAILIALGLTIIVYATIAVTLLTVLGPDGIAATPAPLAAAVDASTWTWAVPVEIGRASCRERVF